MQGDLEDLRRLQQQLQHEANSESILARLQQSASLTTEQAGIVLEALAAGAKHGQPGQPALSLSATLQRLVAASCKLQTVALVALELSRQAQQHSGPASAEAASCDMALPDRAPNAPVTKTLQAASKAVTDVAVKALRALKKSRSTGTVSDGAPEARKLTSNASIGPVLAVLACLEDSADGNQPDVRWTPNDFQSALCTARDEVWSQLANAVMAATRSSSTSIDVFTLALLDAIASVAPLHSSSTPTR